MWTGQFARSHILIRLRKEAIATQKPAAPASTRTVHVHLRPLETPAGPCGCIGSVGAPRFNGFQFPW